MRLASVLASLLLAGTVAAAAAVAADPDRMTICHKADGTARTMEVARSAWSGHRGHGDHEGACTSADGRPPTAPGSPTNPAPRPRSVPVALRLQADGDADGDATVTLRIANRGEAPAYGVRVAGQLEGEGRWVLRAGPCSVDGPRLTCAMDRLSAASAVDVRLDLDGPLAVCREVTVTVGLTADNDATSGDDQARQRFLVGACSPLDQP